MAKSVQSPKKAGVPGLDVAAPLLPLITGLKKAYQSADHSDLTITCKGSEWKVHKVLLCAQSDYFQKMLSGPFKEAKEHKIELDDDDPQTVDAMLHYLYNFDYGDYGNSQEHACPLILDVRMFAIADKYLVGPLKKMAADKFTKRAEAEWGTNEFAAAIAEAYTMIPKHDRTLEEIIVRIIERHVAEVFADKSGYDALRRVVGEIPRLGGDLLDAMPLGPH